MAESTRLISTVWSHLLPTIKDSFLLIDFLAVLSSSQELQDSCSSDWISLQEVEVQTKMLGGLTRAII